MTLFDAKNPLILEYNYKVLRSLTLRHNNMTIDCSLNPPHAANATELTDAELMRYARQILLEGWDIEAQLKLKNSRIVIVGAGGLGCPASETLARAGVGRIHIIDDDLIEMSNLQRQTLFNPENIGQPKAQVAAQTLQEINELISLSHHVGRINKTNADQLLKLTDLSMKNEGLVDSHGDLPDLLLDCTDNFSIRDILNRFSVTYGVPLLSASAIGMTGQLALYQPAENSGCYHCVFGESIQHALQLASSEAKDSPAVDERTCANSGVLASTTAIMGALQANTALQYLGLGNNPLAQKLLLWDGKRMTQRHIGYRPDPYCPVCADRTNESRGIGC